jgi:nondiscriminating aspartyl-tRNA synthetase
MDKGNQISLEIQSLLSSKSIPFRYLEHEPTPTSEDSARVRGTALHEGAKALILKTSKSNQNYMVVLPGDLKIDTKKLREILGDSFSFENPEVIFEKYGLVIGGVPPFGFMFGIKTYYDMSILENENVSFNCGTQTKSIDMKVTDFKNAVEGEWVDLSKK